MWLADNWKDYEVLDTSAGEKLERWGKYILVRPDPQVIWNTPKDDPLWRKYDARYARSNTGGGKWQNLRLPAQWQVRYKDLTFNIKTMGFKHTGLFPEQAVNWDLVRGMIEGADRPVKVLNLFAYTGGATVACLKSGAQVVHVDASKGMVQWAKENAAASGVADGAVRWIVDDCIKFVQREIRRGNRYDIVPPPPVGQSAAGELCTGSYITQSDRTGIDLHPQPGLSFETGLHAAAVVLESSKTAVDPPTPERRSESFSDARFNIPSWAVSPSS